MFNIFLFQAKDFELAFVELNEDMISEHQETDTEAACLKKQIVSFMFCVLICVYLFRLFFPNE